MSANVDTKDRQNPPFFSETTSTLETSRGEVLPLALLYPCSLAPIYRRLVRLARL
jgi:hypothetical protein